MSTLARNPVSPALSFETWVAHLAAQPRASRVFNRDLEVLWDNTPNRIRRFPLYRDDSGRVAAVPPPGKQRSAWPVERAFKTGRTSKREYDVTAGPSGKKWRIRVLAYPADVIEGGPLVVEETERLGPAATSGIHLEQLESELAEMIRRACDLMFQEHAPRHTRLRVTHPQLRSCYKIRSCANLDCPAHQHSGDLPCWEINHTFCPGGVEPQDPMVRIKHCVECDVFLLSCPDTMTRLAERINQLFHIIEIKYEEARKIHQAMQQAEKLAVIGELTSGIAHEIKNPLGVILGRLDCLALEYDGLSAAQVAEDLDVIRAHALRMRTVLDKFLSLARPTLPVPEWLRIDEAISEVLSMMRKTLDEAHIQLDVTLKSGLPRVYAPPVEVHQVLLNVILNARDAMPDGGRLTIETRREDNGAPGVAVTLMDTGRGIRPEDLDQIFSPFYSTKREGDGTGLGLAVCQRIMQQAQGKIAASSAPGRGTTFSLWFRAEMD